MHGLLIEHTLAGKTWQDLQTQNLRGPINISSTDPAKSNSGFTLAQLELSTIATDGTRPPTITEARAALPQLRQLYDAQGLQAATSDNGFRQWLTQGGEYAAPPLYAGYESQIIQEINTGPNAAGVLQEVRVLYPDPTMYSDHPLLALDADAAKLIEALKDPELQTLAWKKYGFRSATNAALNNTADFPDLPLAPRVRTIPAPNAEVTLALLGCLQDRTQCG